MYFDLGRCGGKFAVNPNCASATASVSWALADGEFGVLKNDEVFL